MENLIGAYTAAVPATEFYIVPSSVCVCVCVYVYVVLCCVVCFDALPLRSVHVWCISAARSVPCFGTVS